MHWATFFKYTKSVLFSFVLESNDIFYVDICEIWRSGLYFSFN